jgi:hypothetical protein
MRAAELSGDTLPRRGLLRGVVARTVAGAGRVRLRGDVLSAARPKALLVRLLHVRARPRDMTAELRRLRRRGRSGEAPVAQAAGHPWRHPR